MSVYVDPLGVTTIGPRWRWPKGCHLTADTIDELHAFAVSTLGLNRSWFQDREDAPHYDLSPNMRARAVRCGAVEITAREAVERMQERRKQRMQKRGDEQAIMAMAYASGVFLRDESGA